MAPSTLLEASANTQLHIPPETPPTSAERLHAFESLVASLPEAPAVPLAALDRENLYP